MSLLTKFIGSASLLLCCIFFVQCQSNGQECYSSYPPYFYNLNRDVLRFDYASQTYEGPVEICINGEYESVCDIGWDQADADVVCKQLFGYNSLAEPLYGLGDPHNRYINRTFYCHEYSNYLGSCYSTSTIDKECFNGSHVAGVRCKEVCYEGSVMSVEQEQTYHHEHGLTTYVGQFKVCINGSYHEICDVGWDNHDAQMACNYWFGEEFVGEVDQSVPFSGSPYIVQNMSCNGPYAYSLHNCDYSPATSPECTSGRNHSARYICRQVCSEGDVRLVDQDWSYDVDGMNTLSGTVQVCINQQYVYIYSEDWDDRDADVVCRSLSSTYHAPYYENTASTSSRIYRDIPIYYNATCNGTENDFSECLLTKYSNYSSCPTVGAVQCAPVISKCYSEGHIRLANTSYDYTEAGYLMRISGRVEVCINNSYHSLCYQYWDPADAQVLCQSYVYYFYRYTEISGKPAYPSHFGYSKAGLVSYDVKCDGSEYSLYQCTREEVQSSSLFCEDPTTSAAGVQCIATEFNEPCMDYTLRLSNKTETYSLTGYSVEGTVQVCIGGSYHAICDEGWDDNDAQVICSHLGYERRFYSGTALHGLTSTVPNIAEDVMCFGNETNAFQCSYTTPPVTPRCYEKNNAAGVRCTQVRRQCFQEGDIEFIEYFNFEVYRNIFTGEPSTMSGRVGVCHNEEYHSVCDVNWDENDASVLCNQFMTSVGTPLHGLPDGPNPVSLEDVRCTGNETYINDCPTSIIGEVLNPVCLETNHSAGATCTFAGCINGIYRLSDGPTFYEGRVETCYNNEWLSVCDAGSDMTYASTVCQGIYNFGGNATLVKGGAYGRGMGEQLVLCRGSAGMYETYADMCSSLVIPDARTLCNRDRDVGVRCTPGPLVVLITPTGAPTIGNNPFALECSGTESPWTARLDSHQWYKDGTPIPEEGPISVELIEDVYNSNLYSFDYKFRSRLTFGRPLSASDRGEYTCSTSVQLSYPDDSTYLLTNSTSYALTIQVLSPTVAVQMNGTQMAGTHLEVHCFVELSTQYLAPYITIDFLNSSFGSLSSLLEENPQENIQLLSTRQHNETHYVRTLILDPLQHEDQDYYYCLADYSTSYLHSPVTLKPVFLQVFSNENETDLLSLHGLLPFGTAHGDSELAEVDDGHSLEIILGVRLPIFGSYKKLIYVNSNGVLSFKAPFTRTSSYGFTFDKVLSPHIITPFWDDIDITKGGTIYYRLDTDPTLAEQLVKEISIQYPQEASFNPSLVFVATWDRVAAYSSDFEGLFNTFQAAIVSDGTRTFVRFSYRNLEWGGPETLIGLSAGDGFNFITHPASLSTLVLSLENSTFTYQVEALLVPPPPECSEEGELLTYFNTSFDGQLSSHVGTFEICLGGYYGSVCDIGWNQAAAQTVCRSQFGRGYVAEPIYHLGDPNRRYIGQNFNCSHSDLGLENCSYDTTQSISSLCYADSHVAGVRCSELAPPPSGVHGLCALVVWNRPAQLSCGRINGYDVKLYLPQSTDQNVIRRVGSNGTFYVMTDEDRLAGYSYFQVRVLYNGEAGQWSEGVFIGCDEPTTTEPEVHRVYFELKGNVYLNNSALPLADIGEGTNALLCRTDKTDCCGTRPNRFGEFYYPNGVRIPIALQKHGFYRDRSDQFIRLNRRRGTSSPTGMFRCEIPNSDDVMVKIYITLTS